MLPGAALGLGEGGIFFDLFEPLSATVEIAEIGPVQLEVRSDYPFEGSVTIEIGLERTATFPLRLRNHGGAEAGLLPSMVPRTQPSWTTTAICALPESGRR